MRITHRQLRKIIRESLKLSLSEGPGNMVHYADQPQAVDDRAGTPELEETDELEETCGEVDEDEETLEEAEDGACGSAAEELQNLGEHARARAWGDIILREAVSQRGQQGDYNENH